MWIKGGYQHIEYTNPSNPVQDATMTSIYGQSVGATSVTALTIGGAGQTKKLDIYWLGGNYDITAKLNVALGWYEIDQSDFSNGTGTAADTQGDGKFGSIVLDYHISKPFDVYAGYMNGQYTGGLAAGYPLASNNIFGAGARYIFSDSFRPGERKASFGRAFSMRFQVFRSRPGSPVASSGIPPR